MRFSTLTLLLFLFLSISILGQELPDSVKQKLAPLDDYSKIELLSDLCWNNRERDAQTAIFYGNLALQLADSIDFTHQIAELNNFVGAIYMHYEYDSKRAIPYFHHALEAALIIQDSVQIGYAYNNLGDAFFLTGNAPLALQYAENSLDYFEALNDPRGIAYSYTNLGLVYRFNNDYRSALNYFTESMNIGLELDNKNAVAYAILELARTYYAAGNLDMAMEHFSNSFSIHKEINNKIYMAHCLVGIGNTYYERSDYTNALDNYNLALQLNIERNHQYGILDSRLGLALVYSRTGRRTLGESELDKALRIAIDLGLSHKLLDTYETIAKFYLNVNDYKSATENFNSFLAIYDSLYSQQQFETLSEVQNKFEINQRLTESNRDLEIQKTEEFYLIIIIVMMIIIASVIFWRYRSNKRLNYELKAINESKDKLFSIISHDLKNPFFTLMGFIEILKEEDLTAEERNERIDDLDLTTKATYSLLENLLNLSAARTGKITFSATNFSLSDLVINLIETVSPQLKKKLLRIESNLETESIYGDHYMLEIVLRNLLTNAIKYSNPGDTISVNSRSVKRHVYISVIDSGIGIPKEIQEILFTTKLVDSQRGTAGEKGTGLGLDLCREFIEKHNGEISVNSEIGKGSEFTIILPNKK